MRPGSRAGLGPEVVAPLRDYQLALDEAVRTGAAEPELPAEFREWGQPEMWRANIEALL